MSDTDIRKFFMPEVLTGSGCRVMAGHYAANIGMKKVLVVTDKNVLQLPWTQDVLSSFSDYGLNIAIFDEVSPNPRDIEVMSGAEFYKAEKCDGIVAIGGGSPMDCAKGIGIVATNGRNIIDYKGIDMIPLPMPPLICVPSTAGSSSDVTQFSVILNTTNKVKIAIVSKAIIPDISLVDPETTDTMDLYLTACTGMDTLVHAIEAYVSLGNSFLTDLHAIKAIEILADYLGPRIKNLKDKEARDQIMYASVHAGLAFSNAILGAVHAMAHSLGGMLDLVHGECNAILLEHVIEYNYEAAEERYDKIGKAFGLDSGNLHLPMTEKRRLLVSEIKKLKNEVGITKSLRDAGVKLQDIPMLSVTAYNDPCLLTNPRKMKIKDLENIYDRAY
ncbi:MAG: iron-containing alcohol dehydrogenase [Clostridiales bacterium]|nr:iron-containing alcohol dehydrogenase [Clostridiales bacterium]